METLKTTHFKIIAIKILTITALMFIVLTLKMEEIHSQAHLNPVTEVVDQEVLSNYQIQAVQVPGAFVAIPVPVTKPTD